MDLARFRRDRAALRSANRLMGDDAAGTLSPDAIQSVAFDYGVLDQALATEARNAATRIRTRLKTAYIATGRDLLAIKDRLSRGRFGKWLAAEFEMTERSAERYMAAARLIEKSDKLSDLPHQTIYALACAPESVRESLMERVADGTFIRARDVRAAASEARSRAKQENFIADRRAREATQRKLRGRRRTKEELQRLERERRQAEADKAAAELVSLLHDRLGSSLAEVIGLLDTINDNSITWSISSLLDRLRNPRDNLSAPSAASPR